MKCIACQHEVDPVTEFTTGGLMQMCPRIECGVPLGAVQHSESEPPPRPAAIKKRTAKAPAPESFDVIKAAKVRLRELNRRIKELKLLEQERDKLQRLLTAAERPLAEVKRLRANS